ncbi:MAG TPA: protocatechuate 3,4-dioxygenase subunit alpha [Gammaproteobacteria bacterium]|nr:protocatechuate 3,4-dioxygenase subunit alpha [Gammaproteobacteria bacterium]HIN59328.1 protocatechuate 3,4-dioxygenase subunit alpha [Gammaproteobacteria bacterium]
MSKDPLHHETSSQTVGPFVHIGLYPAVSGIVARSRTYGNQLATTHAYGQRIRVEGQIIDGNGETVRDALLEFWQADGHGRYAHPADPQAESADVGLSGFGRSVTNPDTGTWTLESIKPGTVTDLSQQPMAPHINLALFARGLNIHLHSRIYFDDEVEANALDPVLQHCVPAPRRQTLIARRQETTQDPCVYRFDMVLQGKNETVFFDL